MSSGATERERERESEEGGGVINEKECKRKGKKERKQIQAHH